MNYSNFGTTAAQQEDIMRHAALSNLNSARDELARIQESKDKTDRTLDSFVGTLKQLQVSVTGCLSACRMVQQQQSGLLTSGTTLLLLRMLITV